MIYLFEFIIGKVVSIKEDYVIVQNNGIGYRMYTSSNTISKLEIDKHDQLLYTQLHVREDGIFLFGFSNEDEMDMFNMLLLVSKIGPKIALGILSTLSPNKIRMAIINKEIDILCKAPGIGKKTAERMIVELKDRIDKNALFNDEEIIIDTNSDLDEGVEALISLGYSRYEAEGVVRQMDVENMSLESIIKEGLKKLSKH